MQRVTITFLLLLLISAFAYGWLSFKTIEKKTASLHIVSSHPKEVVPKELSKLKHKALEIKSFAKQKGLDTSVCFLIDMSLPANHKRFFIYDQKKDTILNSGLVTHGNCNQYWLSGRKYGNEIGCGCTSLGKYKTGNSYHGRFGLAFKLYGLDKTNSNAFKRYVVLHSHSCVPSIEVEEEICQSNGCPTVSPDFLKLLEPIIKNSKKPVLLWIYDDRSK